MPPGELSDQQVVDGMRAIKAKVAACYAGVPGVAQVALTVGANGRVTIAKTTGPLAGTTEARCVEAVVRSAQFPPLTNGVAEQSFQYPFVLR
jgi:hypothetical protein